MTHSLLKKNKIKESVVDNLWYKNYKTLWDHFGVVTVAQLHVDYIMPSHYHITVVLITVL